MRDGREKRALLRLGEACYPEALAEIADPPVQIHLHGRLPRQPRVAIVGSRACTSYGRCAAHRLAFQLARRDIAIVSGLARGIDAAAHRGALAASGVTVAVLPGGLEPVYPRSHRALAACIGRAGALVAEHEPGTPVTPWQFPKRNRIIAGLSQVTVVVEAAERSGARITADLALDYNRDVMVVPGPITSPVSAGCHALLAQGAAVCTTFEDVLELLPGFERDPGAGARLAADLGPHAVALLDLVRRRQCVDLAVAATELELTVPDALAAVTRLEARGLARLTAGSRLHAC